MRNLTVSVPTSTKDVKEIANKGISECVMVGKRIVNSKEVIEIKHIASKWLKRAANSTVRGLDKVSEKIIDLTNADDPHSITNIYKTTEKKGE
jgi:hypothetical protein